MNNPANFIVHDLGRMAYLDALHVQRRVHDDVLHQRDPQTVLLVEHDPVITVSQRKGAGQHLLVSADRLRELGIDVQPTDRGGDITYHGPGQLVAYPILRLAPLGLNISRYMRLLEDVVIDTAGRFDASAERDACARGVWVNGAKLAAVGVRVRKNVTLHGLAVNVTTNLDHFKTIIPCGLADRRVTSLRATLGDRCPTMQQVKDALVEAMHARLRLLS